MILYYILAAVAGAVIALAIYIAVSRASARGRASAIIEKAELEGEKRRGLHSAQHGDDETVCRSEEFGAHVRLGSDPQAFKGNEGCMRDR